MQKKIGMIIIGGGLIKHNICNANLMRNDADFSVYINITHEFDGSDSGERPDEAVSWGKIKIGAKSTKAYAEISLVFPVIVGGTFASNPKVASKLEQKDEEKKGNKINFKLYKLNHLVYLY